MSPAEDEIRAAVDRLVDGLEGVVLARQQRDLVVSMVETVVGMARTDSDLLDLKIVDTALKEMAEAFEVFRPWRSVRKVTMFGSARTAPDDPIYVLARDLARRLATEGWMIVTGAGPGIMAAGTEGAGRDLSFGVNIRLPHEQGANAFIAQDPKLVEMRYFFTRKLMLIKESHAYVVLPGGFGTLDECFELLTLLQTGKAEPAPVVLVETPGEGFWHAWLRFVEHEVVPRGYVSAPDLGFFRIVTSVDEAVAEIQRYYRNYHSARWVGDLLVLRLARLPDDASLVALSAKFADILKSGRIRATKPLPPERTAGDHLDLERVALRFDKFSYARLRELIDALNEF
ncbi:MAG TPA: TIGR00730 family Rossman fold protein [Acidimicrobiales bacterium]|nr:TIGR00730 family Rossman fold protein [Acidimicrobiales bacterium]